MAPSSKGTNPAPNYTVAMNQVQTQIEAQLRVVRSFMPPRPAPSAKPSASFSALSSGTSTPSQTRQQAQKQDEDGLFTETRAQDPNAGLGFGAPSKRAIEKEKEHSVQKLRRRLLERKRGAGDEHASGRALHRDESSDEEPGRSGLGRAKKRVRREESTEEERTPQPVVGPIMIEAELEKVGAKDPGPENDKLDEEVGDEDMEDASGAASLRDNSVPNGAEDAPEQKKNKKRKRKKKKKAKSEEADGE